MIPAGIKPGEVEFFQMETNLYAMVSGSQVSLCSLPAYVYDIIDRSIDIKANEALDALGITDVMERRKQFLKCNCTEYDFTPDIAPGQTTLNLEYVACGLRGGLCSFEGSLCKHIIIDGQKISLAELRVISCIRQGLQDKEICSRLGIALDTLRSHKRNIQPKIGALSKVQIATQSIKYGIS
jgi:DNA-binding CsgD family transcriptional regulator